MALILLDDILDTFPFRVLHKESSRQHRNLQHMKSKKANYEVIGFHNTEDGFKANLDVQQFMPDELSVKMVEDFVVVEGRHEERQDDHGFVSRQFVRRYKLPEDVDSNAVTSALSSDGVLTISAPKKKPVPLADVNERIVPILRI